LDRRFTLLLICFFLSGFSALLYQTAWTREFAFVFGTSEIAIAAVLAGYMGGLALGSALAARIAPRLTRPILAYGVLELGIAVCALALPLGMRALTAVYVAIFAGADPAIAAVATPFRLAGAFALLLPPTALMGATLPLLARHAVRRDEEVGPRVGALYAINTAGAIGGTVCAAFLLLPALGLRQTVALGALVNGLVFVAAAALARGAPAPPEPLPRAAAPAAGGWILPLMLASGAVSFGYEVLWTRLLSQLLGGSLYSFATMLASFLAGIALGSAAGGLVARRTGRAPAGFAWSQIGVAVLGAAAFAAADRLPALARALGTGSASGPLANAPLAAAVLLPVAICIGATFPLAVRVLAPDPSATAAASARVYAWNTVGAIVGAIGAGFFVLPGLGFAGAVRAFCATSLLIAAAAAVCAQPRRRAGLAAAAAGAAALWLAPIGTPWQLLRASPFSAGRIGDEPIRFFAVGRSTTVLLLEHPGRFRLFTNGLPESTIVRQAGIPGRELEGRWLGLLPSLLRPHTDRVLVIGLGGGIALEGIPPAVGEVDVVELEAEVVAANRAIGAERAHDPLAEPRVRVLVDDARGALMLSPRRYDAIVSQPSHPWTAGASHLYTREFFALASERLADDGVFVQWIGVNFVDETLLRSLLAALTDVFPHVDVYRPVPGALLFAGSRSPLDIAAGRAALAADRDHFAKSGLLVIEDAAACLALDADGTRALAAGAPANTDDWNLLASGSARLRDWSASGAPLRELFARHDPLAARAQRGDLDRLALVRSLARRRLPDRGRALAGSFPDLEREIALGYVEAADARPRAAARHFARALELDPASPDARIGAATLDRDAAGSDLPEPVALLRRAAALRDAGGAEERLAIDAELAAIGPASAVYDSAALLRADLRIRTGEPARAAEALGILDRQLARTDQQHIQLQRARAAALAGRTDAAWVALDDVAERMPRGRHLAKDALAVADSLPAHPLESQVRAVLLRAAR
jgi:spermidine synthase